MTDAEKMVRYATDLANAQNLHEDQVGLYVVGLLADSVRLIVSNSPGAPDGTPITDDRHDNNVVNLDFTRAKKAA